MVSSKILFFGIIFVFLFVVSLGIYFFLKKENLDKSFVKNTIEDELFDKEYSSPALDKFNEIERKILFLESSLGVEDTFILSIKRELLEMESFFVSFVDKDREREILEKLDFIDREIQSKIA